MANVLKMEKQILIEQLVSLGWSYRRIERETGIRRETISRYDPKHPRNIVGVKPAKVPTEAGADTSQNRPKCPPSERDVGADLPPPVRPTRVSSAAPFDAEIREKLDAGLSAQRIYQDLVVGHGYEGKYDSVKRYVRKLRAKTPELVGRVHVAPGEEAQVDFGTGAPTLKDGRYRKPWLFKMVLSHSRHSYEEVVWRQDVETFIRCHERAFEAFGGVPRVVRVDYVTRHIIGVMCPISLCGLGCIHIDFVQPERHRARWAGHIMSYSESSHSSSFWSSFHPT